MNKDQERIDYHTYIRSQDWYKRRYGALKRAGGKCQVCSSTEQLQIHHNSYANLGHESAADLVCLCEKCHQIFHKFGCLAPAPQEVQS